MEPDSTRIRDHVPYLAPGDGPTLRLFGELVTRKVTGDRTAGAYSLFEVASAPGTGPPPHVQHRADEAFWVLDGEYEFRVEGEVRTATAGALVHVPRGRLHSHRNVGRAPARLLMIQTPAGLYERFLVMVGQPVTSRRASPASTSRPDPDSVVRIAAGFGIEIRPEARRDPDAGVLGTPT